MKTIERCRAGFLTALLAATLVPGAALASDDSMANEAGIGALSALSSLIYGPVKLVYATCGTLFGGIAWGLSGGDSDVLAAVMTPAVRGDYVVTPGHLRNEKRLEFFGQDPAYRTSSTPQTAMSDEDQEPLIEDY